MIGAFARMLGSHDRVLSVEQTAEGVAVKSSGGAGRYDERQDAGDAPPARFVEKLSEEGGDVYVVPMLEALRQWVRKRIADERAAASTPAQPAEETL